MYIGLISKRYAKALLDFSIENGDSQQAYLDATEVNSALRLVPEVRDALDAPVLSVKEKENLIFNLVDVRDNMSGSFSEFIKLIVRRNRQTYLPFILNSFIDLYKVHNHIKDAELITPSKPDNALIERICTQEEGRTGCRVNISSIINPEIIGGFIYRIDDMRLDASVQSQLKRIIKAFDTKPKRIVIEKNE